MKKILVTTLVACALVSSALAQGLITFSATTGNLIQYSPDATLGSAVRVAVGNPAQVPGYGNLNVALYGAPAGTTLSLVGGIPDLSGAWLMQTSPVLQQIGPALGGMTGKIVTMPAGVLNAAGELQLSVAAWTGTYASFTEAANAWRTGATVYLAWSGDPLSGGALSWLSGSGTATTPYVITKGANAYNGLVLSPIPEPSTFALVGLGAAALLIFRRRK